MSASAEKTKNSENMTDDKAEDSTQEVKPEDDKKESKGNSVKAAADNGTKKKAKEDKSDDSDVKDEASAEEDGDDNDEKSETKKTNEKKRSVANNDKKKSSLDGKKDDGKSNSKNSVNDKKDDDATAKSDSSNKKDSAMSLGEIARIESYITNTKVDGLQILHSICFTGNVKPNMIKNKLRKFAGFDFDADSDEYNTKLEAVQKIDVAKLKAVCEGLTLDKKGSKEDLAERICKFLLAPEGEHVSSYVDYSSSDEEEKYVRPKTARRGKNRDDTDSGSDYNPSAGSDSDAGKKRSTRISGRGAGRPPARRAAKRRRSDSEDETPASSEEDSDAPRKKKRASAGRTRGRRPAARGRKKESETEEEEESEVESEDSDDDEIKSYVKEILDEANLEEITMKTVCKQVYAKYPSFDLSHKKDFIKSTVKSAIFVLAALVAVASARPQNIPIVSQTGVQDESGQYSFSFQTGNGISAVEQGALKPNSDRTDNYLVKQGSYAFVAPDGKTYKTVYVSDENGFQATGDHLPKDLSE
ncbi:Endocuticle structural glycoprotein SgAbd-2 [Pseudolycoriella hygida]|uniref:Endocuticle structural glycoprotein SgAbd-2 n=1 Tax=Pseudolycoriella hygida TaxID=35572 RepID=A0A9Q0N9Z5_9DIPT|nr:Endocuticle structural glycoprotein SgAbd-2 [Pseudolycoriella hygida]